MRTTINLAILFCTILSFVCRASAAAIAPTRPSNDSFYRPPRGYEHEKEGTILKWRKTPFQLETIFFPIHLKNSWQMLVRTTDSHGDPTAIVTTVMEPFNANPAKVVSYQTAEDSSSFDCSPSYAFLHGSSFNTVVTKAEMFLIDTMLQEGFYVVSPDYEGPKATFTAGRQSGHATLDSIRAVLKSSNITGIDTKPEIVMWGYSGGTIASGWAAALQPTYAPELKPLLLGVALGGWVTNVTSTVEAVEGTIFSGLTASGIRGLSNEYPDLADLVETAIIPDKYSNFEDVGNLCLLNSITHFAFARFFSGPNRYATDGWDLLSDDVAKEVLDANTLALHNRTEMPEIPMFVYHGIWDRIVPFKDAQRAYDNFCDWGIDSLEFAVDETAGHISEVITGSPAAIEWIKGRFNGTKPVKGCSRTERFTNLHYPGANIGISDILHDGIASVLGEDIGPNGENITLDHIKRSIGAI